MELCIKYHNLCKHKFEIGSAVLLIDNMTLYLYLIRNYDNLYVLAYIGLRDN